MRSHLETRLAWLEDSNQAFPPPETAFTEPNGLLCAGGDLSTERLLMAYRQGIFPWYEEGQPVLWWSPDPRCILQFEDLHVSRSMQRLLKRKAFRFAFDQAFTATVAACAAPAPRSHATWITPDMARAYTTLHRRIRTVSRSTTVTSWWGLIWGYDGTLLFRRIHVLSPRRCLKSRIHCPRPPSTSHWNYALLDCQVTNPHLLARRQRGSTRHIFIYT